MKCKVGSISLGGGHASAIAVVIPAMAGSSSRTLSLRDGKLWMSSIRQQIHSVAKEVNGGSTPLLAPARLRKKNVTRWATGSADFPADYQCLLDLEMISKWDLWYLLNCEACFETLY